MTREEFWEIVERENLTEVFSIYAEPCFSEEENTYGCALAGGRWAVYETGKSAMYTIVRWFSSESDALNYLLQYLRRKKKLMKENKNISGINILYKIQIDPERNRSD